jgi:hypothetical protein
VTWKHWVLVRVTTTTTTIITKDLVAVEGLQPPVATCLLAEVEEVVVVLEGYDGAQPQGRLG